jgi:ABC-2 type transport system permease protein
VSAVLSIWRREVQAYFVSPIAYVVIVIYLGIATFGFVRSVRFFVALPDMVLEQRGFNIRNYVIRDLSVWAGNVGLLLSLPALSMRLLSEERKVGTAELLMTSPVTTLQLVLGKYLGTLTMLALMLGLTTPFVAILAWKGSPEMAAIGTAYVGYFLFGAVTLAAGLFASSLTENQIVALLMTYAISVALWCVELVVGFMGAPWDDILLAASVGYGMRMMAQGLVDTHFLALDLGLIFMFLFLCAEVIDSNRWR